MVASLELRRGAAASGCPGLGAAHAWWQLLRVVLRAASHTLLLSHAARACTAAPCRRFDPLWNSLVVGGFYAGQPFLGTVGMIGTNYTDVHLATGGLGPPGVGRRSVGLAMAILAIKGPGCGASQLGRAPACLPGGEGRGGGWWGTGAQAGPAGWTCRVRLTCLAPLRRLPLPSCHAGPLIPPPCPLPRPRQALATTWRAR